MAPPIRKAATGINEIVSQPTWILAGEAGDEHVSISSAGNGGGGQPARIIFNIDKKKLIDVLIDDIRVGTRYIGLDPTGIDPTGK
jgi:hypothetical protein